MSCSTSDTGLRVALDANSTAYRNMVHGSAPGDCWDFLILTAANEHQADLYRKELSVRSAPAGPVGPFFPPIQKNVVVPDPPRRRIGSGGATLAALRYLMSAFSLRAGDLDNLRILMVHSGGPSMRLPACSAAGRVFAPLPMLRPDGQICTLFDHLYMTLAGLPQRLGPGLLIVAGDVLLVFDHRLVGSGPHAGVRAITMRVDAAVGTAHGVFVTAPDGTVRRVVQKACVEDLRRAGAVDDAGRVCVDTGLLFFDPAAARRLASLAGRASGGAPPAGRPAAAPRNNRADVVGYAGALDLYEDITGALAAETDPRAFLDEGRRGAVRRALWKALHGVPFKAIEVEGAFVHLKTTEQFRDAMAGRADSPASRWFSINVMAHGRWKTPADARVYNSVLLGGSGRLGSGSVVECSVLGGGSRIGAGSVVSQALAVRVPPEVGDEMLFFQVPLRTGRGARGYAQVLCGVRDDFLAVYGGQRCTFLNEPMENFMRRHGISPRELWGSGRRTLWTARLFPITEDRDAFDAVAWFARRRACPLALRAWRRMKRASMAMLLERADPAGIIEHREVVAAMLQTGQLLASIQRDGDEPVERFLGSWTAPAAYEAAWRVLAEWGSGQASSWRDKLRQARAMWCAAQVLQRLEAAGGNGRQRIEQCMRGAFARIAEASEADRAAPVGQNRSGAVTVVPGLCVEATCPVRLDLAGGWTDTPPYCYERGGHVVNVAIDLEGAPPVRAAVRAIDRPVLVLEALDLGYRAVLEHIEAGPPDVRDPLALHKAAMQMAGLLPEEGGDAGRIARRIGAGLVVSTECRVPKGSGLGTSSILAATLLAALHAAAGRPVGREQLIRQTLVLEQRLTTGGGWQDQIGGLVGGTKSITTAPGVPQHPQIERLAPDGTLDDELQRRLVVYYSGQQRLARDILRRVVGRWLAREPAAVMLLEDLGRQAELLRQALLDGDWPKAASAVARYWDIKKQLYPGSTTPAVDMMFLELRGHYLAAGLAGAGGGGFAYFLCADERQAARLKALLEEMAGRPGHVGALYRACVNRRGLTVVRRRGHCDKDALRI